MTLYFVEGDLFVNRYHAQAFAHGCNCIGAMGVGIAVEFRRRYPGMYDHYRSCCLSKPRTFNPGNAMYWGGGDDQTPAVFNLATQEDTRYWKAKPEWMRVSMIEMLRVAGLFSITRIAMPMIGAGYGGLSRNAVKKIISALPAWSGDLYVYEVYVPGE